METYSKTPWVEKSNEIKSNLDATKTSFIVYTQIIVYKYLGMYKHIKLVRSKDQGISIEGLLIGREYSKQPRPVAWKGRAVDNDGLSAVRLSQIRHLDQTAPTLRLPRTAMS